MLVYLDTNVYCRPFDDQSQKRIRREATAFVELDALHIAAACLGKAAYCVTCNDLVLKRADCCAKVTEEHGFKVILIGPEELKDILKGGKTL